MDIDGVFSGGGIKGLALIGAYEELESQGFTFNRVAGTSAGSIIAGFIAAGYSSQEMKNLFHRCHMKVYWIHGKHGCLFQNKFQNGFFCIGA